jgi:hypothetical protein
MIPHVAVLTKLDALFDGAEVIVVLLDAAHHALEGGDGLVDLGLGTVEGYVGRVIFLAGVVEVQPVDLVAAALLYQVGGDLQLALVAARRSRASGLLSRACART